MRIAWIQSPNAGGVELRFTAGANRSYSVWWRRSANSGAWIKLADIPAEPLTRVVTVPHVDPLEATRFCRLVSPVMPP